MALETQIPGSKISVWLSKSPPEQWNLLTGNLVDDNVSEDAWEIIAIRAGCFDLKKVNAPEKTYTMPWIWLAKCFLIVSADRQDLLRLFGPVAAHENEFDDAYFRVHSYGFNCRKFSEESHIKFLDHILTNSRESGIVPRNSERRAAYQIVRQYSEDAPAIPVFRSWMEAVEAHNYPEFDLLGRLHLAVMLRYTGELLDSLSISAILEKRLDTSTALKGEFAALSLNRAATMLDTYVLSGEKTIFQAAKRHIDRAISIAPSGEAFATYARWRRLLERPRLSIKG